MEITINETAKTFSINQQIEFNKLVELVEKYKLQGYKMIPHVAFIKIAPEIYPTIPQTPWSPYTPFTPIY